MSYLPLCIIGIAIQAAFILVENRKKYVPAVILKGSAAMVFIIIGALSAQLTSNPNFAKLVVIGLILGGIGDVLLNLRFVFEKNGQKIFLLGVVSFLSGHIMYLAALILISNNLLVSLICGVIAAALLLRWIFSKIGEVQKVFKIFGYVYIGAIVLMTAAAIGNLVSNPGSMGALLFVMGAVLFTASDVIMIFNTFGGTQKFSMRAANLSLYYLGQLLIAISLQFI
ncbi:MAG TPA: lysoplasmalogenase [Syntrophomonadaceae bacterium]|nr:lysoplasmalogenase [Syntrophomonadaceae bacterium]HQE24341.1 lysoplasmalogenase [Syntrophomonadaceae bacterium]